MTSLSPEGAGSSIAHGLSNDEANRASAKFFAVGIFS